MRIEMPYDAEWIIGRIREHGFEAFAVGGCVRDSVLGRKPEDWDITTSARPEEVKAIFSRTVDTGLEHGTVTVLKNGSGYEVTTYRIDGEYRDARHPDSVTFTSNLNEDLKRRDFTINAMAYSHETGIVDPFGGLSDLEAGIIRCVGRPEDRFSEDALRILRAIRFSAQLGFSIEEQTMAAIIALAPNLIHVSRERVQVELTKLLLSAYPERMLLVHETGIDRYVTDEFEGVFEYREAGNGAWLEGLKKLPAQKSLRWAGFLRYVPPDTVAKILRGLKLDNETISSAKAMTAAFQEPLICTPENVRRRLSQMTEDQFKGSLSLLELEQGAQVEQIWETYRGIVKNGDCVRLRDLAVGGADLIRAGMKPGKELGDTLNQLFNLVLEHPEYNKKEILMEMWRKGSLE